MKPFELLKLNFILRYFKSQEVKLLEKRSLQGKMRQNKKLQQALIILYNYWHSYGQEEHIMYDIRKLRKLIALIKEYEVHEIRVLPMDKKIEFVNKDQVENFFIVDLIADGKFYYQKRGIRVRKQHALILFQYDNEIVAYAVLEEAISLKEIGEHPYTAIVNGQRIKYYGYYQFYDDSIQAIQGITSEELRNTVDGFKRFSQSKQFIRIKYIKEICKLLYRKQVAFERGC